MLTVSILFFLYDKYCNESKLGSIFFFFFLRKNSAEMDDLSPRQWMKVSQLPTTFQ